MVITALDDDRENLFVHFDCIIKMNAFVQS